MESPSVFVQYPELSGIFWHPFQNTFSQDRERVVSGAVSKRGQETNLVMHSQCKEEVSSQSSGSLVNPVNDDERKIVGLASGNWGHSDSKNSKLDIPK